MLAARGVSLGLGKINLSDLNQLPNEKHRYFGAGCLNLVQIVSIKTRRKEEAASDNHKEEGRCEGESVAMENALM